MEDLEAVRRASRRQLALVLLALAGLPTAACRLGKPEIARPGFGRGIVLVSLDTLRADALGAYGAAPGSSPVFDSLAAQGVLFERAFAQIPATLPSHMTMFTGLYPGEHGVYPPSNILSPEIPTLPEAFAAAQFRTAGHTESGFVQGGYGFARGFGEWSDREYAADTDLEETFARGLASLGRLGPTDRFFLFLHSYSIHDPYAPTAEFRDRFLPRGLPAGAFEPTGENFASFNKGRLRADDEAVAAYRALYAASVAYADRALGRFVAELERMGLADETTLVVTSDHGEEFLEHGKLVHTQIYPESLHVPLLVVLPGAARGRRVPGIVRLVDLAPTLLDLAGVAPLGRMSGRSLLPLLAGSAPDEAAESYAEDEMDGGVERTLLAERDGHLTQLIRSVAQQEPDGHWVSRQLRFDASGPELDFRAVAFHEPRTVTVEIDGRPSTPLAFATDWASFSLPLPEGGKHTVRLATPDCVTPYSLGLGNDARCLSFKLQGLALERLELFDLTNDPSARSDLSTREPALLRALLARLKSYTHQPLASAGKAALTAEQERQLKALGYL